MGNHQKRSNYPRLARFYCLLNAQFCWSCLCSSKEFICAGGVQQSVCLPAPQCHIRTQSGCYSCSQTKYCTFSTSTTRKKILHASSNQVKTKRCDTQNSLESRTRQKELFFWLLFTSRASHRPTGSRTGLRTERSGHLTRVPTHLVCLSQVLGIQLFPSRKLHPPKHDLCIMGDSNPNTAETKHVGGFLLNVSQKAKRRWICCPSLPRSNPWLEKSGWAQITWPHGHKVFQRFGKIHAYFFRAV